MDWLLENSTESIDETISPWRVAIVDDDPEVHKITQLTLASFTFEDRPIEFINAYSGSEAKQLFEDNDDIAMVLLDVVMEQSDSGLNVAKYIRNELNNHQTRIVLRTGQPGFAPEEEIVRDYEIDGYKSKTESTSQALRVTMYTMLRGYRDVIELQHYQNGLVTLVNAIASLTQQHKIEDFASALMTQLAAVLNSSHTELIIQDSEAFSHLDDQSQVIQLKTNNMTSEVEEDAHFQPDIAAIKEQVMREKKSISSPPLYAFYRRSGNGTESVFILRNSQELSAKNIKLLDLFSHYVVSMLENLNANRVSH